MDFSTTTAKVCDLAKEAGEIAKKYFKRVDLASHSKGGSDFVTQADLEVDEFLRKKLAQEFPNTQFLTEETAPKDYSSLKDTSNLWIIDPIDGTTDFSRGDDNFAISIAFFDKGEVKVGVVFVPIKDKMYYANSTDERAYCNDEELHVSTISDLQKVSLGYDWSWDLSEREKTHRYIGKLMNNIRQPRALGSAACDLAKVASGVLDAYFITGIKPWDVAAASLLVEKAGGKITLPDGSPWNVFDNEIFASNGKIHDEILTLLRS